MEFKQGPRHSKELKLSNGPGFVEVIEVEDPVEFVVHVSTSYDRETRDKFLNRTSYCTSPFFLVSYLEANLLVIVRVERAEHVLGIVCRVAMREQLPVHFQKGGAVNDTGRATLKIEHLEIFSSARILGVPA